MRIDVQTTRTPFSRMFALKPADEFGLAWASCPKIVGIPHDGRVLVSHPLEKPL
jgi:hypothetical protein